jgi:hypothetical protein
MDNYQLFIVEAQIQPQSSSTGVGLSQSTLVSPLPNIPPLLHIHLPSQAGKLGQFETTVPMDSASPNYS